MGIQTKIETNSSKYDIQETIKQLEKQRDKYQNIAKKAKIKMWKDKMLRNSKHVFKWLREQSPILPSILPDETGRPTSDPIKQLKAGAGLLQCELLQ